jgi:type IV pilus assembly protein PilF
MRRTIAALLLLGLAACATTGAPNNTSMAQGYYDRGINYLQMKDNERAIVEFQRAIQTDPKNKMAYYALGIVNDMMGKPADAERYYEEAVDIDSSFSEAYNALGVVYYKQQKWKQAEKAFRKALENKLYSTPHVPYLNLGDMYMAQREYAKAVDAYRESKRLVNQDITVYKLGMALMADGKVKESVAELQEGTTMAPKNSDMRLALALAYLKGGNKRAALAEFKQVTELAPKSEGARTARDYIATLERDSGRKQRTK